MGKYLSTKVLAAQVALLLALGAGNANAVIDVTDATASIGDAETAIVAVGGLLIGLAAVAMALRWVKAMFF